MESLNKFRMERLRESRQKHEELVLHMFRMKVEPDGLVGVFTAPRNGCTVWATGALRGFMENYCRLY